MPFALAPVVVAVAVAVTPLPKYGTVTQVFYDRVQTNQPIRTCTLQPKYYSESGRPVGVIEICNPY